jgi:hypothetical protein
LGERLGTSVVESGKCSFCEQNAKWTGGNPFLRIDCPCCGVYGLSAFADTMLRRWQYPIEAWASASYQIRRISDRNGPPMTDASIKEMLARPLPKPAEAMDDVVVRLATQSRWPGDTFRIAWPYFAAVFGAVDKNAFLFYLNWLEQTGWVEGIRTDTLEAACMVDARLTPGGWEHFRLLTTSGIYSRKAFMAMAFGQAELDSVFTNYFVPAVALAGFDLQRASDGQTAGLIDDLMRIRIRTSRFVVCDLTHLNRGAYWEAGFAEGLDKPVIYTCREDVFKDTDATKRPHFDTNHLSHVLWTPEDLPGAAERLKAMVRATLPAESNLND